MQEVSDGGNWETREVATTFSRCKNGVASCGGTSAPLPPLPSGRFLAGCERAVRDGKRRGDGFRFDEQLALRLLPLREVTNFATCIPVFVACRGVWFPSSECQSD
jgi:hypothetical protein